MHLDLEALLKEAIGLDATTLGAGSIERALKQRQSACRIADAAAYQDLLRSSPAELQELIEAVVVPETWFFRDREAFTALARAALPEWLASNPGGVMRLLSLPCSTGEEPYSMTMALLDAGLPSSRFRVDAIDISSRALGVAHRAIYGKNSFRGAEIEFRDRYFDATSQGHRLREPVRDAVTFRHGNLFDEDLLRGLGVYDVVFCRNVLIYFDRPAQDQAIRVLARLLAPRAYLFVGPSETGLAMHHGFVSAAIPLAFAFRPPPLAAATPRPAPPVAPRAEAQRRSVPPMATSRRTAPSRGATAVERPSGPASPPCTDLLGQAARLADAGRLDEAQRSCEAFLRDHAAVGQAYYLLGLVRDAAGDPDAAALHYRRALYLDPGHEESLAHLALLLERQGDAGAAGVLRRRARRQLPSGQD